MAPSKFADCCVRFGPFSADRHIKNADGIKFANTRSVHGSAVPAFEEIPSIASSREACSNYGEAVQSNELTHPRIEFAREIESFGVTLSPNGVVLFEIRVRVTDLVLVALFPWAACPRACGLVLLRGLLPALCTVSRLWPWRRLRVGARGKVKVSKDFSECSSPPN